MKIVISTIFALIAFTNTVNAEGKFTKVDFINYVIYNLMTYTPEDIEKRYNDASQFFDKGLKNQSDRYIKDEIDKSKKHKISSILKIDDGSNHLNDYEEIHNLREKDLRKIYKVKIQGKRSFVTQGTVLETKVIKFSIQIQETDVTSKNPFGLILTKLLQENK